MNTYHRSTVKGTLAPFTTLFLAVIAISILLLSGCSSAKPVLFIEQSEIDLGDVVNGDIISRDIVIGNDGDAELVVASVSTSCGCTTAQLDPMTLAPGQRGTLHIEFDSGAHGPDLTGTLIRQVFINAADPDLPEGMVELTANIVAPTQE